MELKGLTNAEEKVMQVIWALDKGFVKEVMNYLPQPPPPYNTISTILRILEDKDFLSHQTFGKAYQYFPLISQEEYKRYAAEKLQNQPDDHSIDNKVYFLVEEDKVNLSKVEEILNMIHQVKNRPR